VLCLYVVLVSFSAAAKPEPLKPNPRRGIASSYLYSTLHLKELGLSEKAFNAAFKGYSYLLRKRKLANTRYLTICDLSQSSRKKRFYIIDMEDQVVINNTWVAHGKNTGNEYATRFSNKLSSKQTSLGFYITRQTYVGENGFSLRMDGIEAGYNDKAYRRAIVVHGADYIGADQLQDFRMGRSFGCPAIPKTESREVINMIKDGSCLFIYHPTATYLKRSKILNG
jgi:hypothetical protein